MFTETGGASSLTMIGDNCELRLMAVGGQNETLINKTKYLRLRLSYEVI